MKYYDLEVMKVLLMVGLAMDAQFEHILITCPYLRIEADMIFEQFFLN